MTDRLLIHNVLVIEPGAADAHRRDISVRNGRIEGVREPSSSTAEHRTTRVIEGRDRLLVPGLVNAHTHSPLSILKGTHDVTSHPAFMWLNQADTAGRTADEVRLSALLGCIEHLLNGTTAVIDHFPEQGFSEPDVDAVVDAYRIAGLRALVALRLFDEDYGDIIPPDGLPPALSAANPLNPRPVDESLAIVEAAIAKHDKTGDGRIRVCPAPSNPSRCSDFLLSGTRAIAERHNTAVHMHLLETRIQAEMAQSRYGTTMVRHLDDLGLLSRRLSTAHTIWIDDSDIELMAERGATAVHNPESNLKIGAGIAPITRMLRSGLTVALGTDGASTNDNSDMHEVMRLALMLQRPFESDRSKWPNATDALVMATTAGGRAMLCDGLGTLAPGAPADFVLHDLSAAFWAPLNDPLYQLVFGGTGSTIDTVVVDGRVLLEDRQIKSFDAAGVLKEVKDLVKHLRARNANLHGLARKLAAAIP